jgi:hypothetical protein
MMNHRNRDPKWMAESYHPGDVIFHDLKNLIILQQVAGNTKVAVVFIIVPFVPLKVMKRKDFFADDLFLDDDVDVVGDTSCSRLRIRNTWTLNGWQTGNREKLHPPSPRLLPRLRRCQ